MAADKSNLQVAGWIEKEKPVAGPLDAVLTPIAVAPCSSDTHVMHGEAGPISNRILGHECVAEVVETGSMVEDFRSGDVVIVPCVTPDWDEVTMQRKGANSAHDSDLMTSFKFVLLKDGVFAEYFHVNDADSNLVLLPENVSIEDAIMMTDMMSTGYYGAEMADIQMGDDVVVFGIGPVGLMAISGARNLGAGRIIAIGTRPNCIELAREYGATDIISYKEGDVVERILGLVPDKINNVILAGGDGNSILQALQIVKNNGNISNVNFLDAADAWHIPAPAIRLGMNDVNIRGGMCPGGAYRIRKCLEMIKADRVHPGKLVNYKYEGFDKIEDAFRVMDEKPRDLIKPIVYIG